MARSRRKDPALLDELFELLKVAPSWLGPVIAGVAFVVLHWVVPWLLSGSGADHPDDPFQKLTNPILTKITRGGAVILAVTILVVWLIAEALKFGDRRRLDRQSGIENIRSLDWEKFERLASEAFRRQGYQVEHTGGSRPDGGVDQRLTKQGKTTLVQCKHWKQGKVGVKVVRELLGVVTSEQANAGIVVTSGSYTDDAIAFASKNSIELIDGNALAELINSVQGEASIRTQPPPAPKASKEPTCPRCNAPMKLRTTQRGPNAGQEFWGCSRFPKCKGTRKREVELADGA